MKRACDPPALENAGDRRQLCRRVSEGDLGTTVEESKWFHAEDHEQDIKDAIASMQEDDRDLHFLDLFSASGQGKRTFEANGYAAVSTDIITNPLEDITSRAGFFLILQMAMRIMEGGLLLGGPPCSLFIFLSSSMHRRSPAMPRGDESRRAVRLSNLVVDNCVVILTHIIPRGVKFIIEQPLTSSMYDMPSFTRIRSSSPEWLAITTYMGCFGHTMMKPTRLVSNMTSCRLLTRPRPPPEAFPSDPDYVRYTPAGAAGGRHLHASAVYTPAFTFAVLVAWEKEFPRM